MLGAQTKPIGRCGDILGMRVERWQAIQQRPSVTNT